MQDTSVVAPAVMVPRSPLRRKFVYTLQVPKVYLCLYCYKPDADCVLMLSTADIDADRYAEGNG
jgi:hypothetical protein